MIPYPQIVALNGPHQGDVYSLSETENWIGRDPSCQIRLAEVSVSRRHCVIQKQQDEFHLIDGDSMNGTFVNGIPVKERVLTHGNRIEVGKILFLFLLHEEETSRAEGVIHLNDEVIPQKTIRLRRENVVYGKPVKAAENLTNEARLLRNWHSLLDISQAIHGIRSIGELQQFLMERIFRIIPAEQGAFLLIGESLENPASVFSWHHRIGAGTPAIISRTVARQVLQEGTALLSNDLSTQEDFQKAKSLTNRRVHSVLCAPLETGEKVIGLIYLDSTDPNANFEEDHLQFLTAVCGIVSVALSGLRYVEWLQEENQRLVSEINPNHGLVGESTPLQEVCRFVAKAAPTDSTILITGESGTGKELVARAAHQSSRRASKSFIAINCAALTETLLESELFGHEKGAFTGAIARKKGKIEIANEGTLFLDEIGEMSLPIQAKLLRVLQEREFERVGGTQSIHVDVRILAATNKNLEEAIKNGTFRQDLFYRLNVLSIRVPSLRERKEDIPLLANYFLSTSSAKLKRQMKGFTKEARECLMNYDWPGNVRELENAVERAVALGSDDWVRVEDFPESLIEVQPATLSGLSKYQEALTQMKRDLIQTAFDQANGVYTETAKILGVHPNYLHRLIRNLNMKDKLKKV
jgi:two-component system, NtrC family, response regulator HydG